MMKGSKRSVNIKLLTKNEKILIVVLGLILIFWVSLKFLFDPQNEKIKYLELEKTKYEEIIKEQNTVVKSEDSIKKEWTRLRGEKEKILSGYLSTLDQSKILYLLNDLMEDERVDIVDLRFTRPYKETKDDVEVQRMDINIPFNGTYDGVMDILRIILSSSRSIVIEGFSMEGGDSSILTGSINLNVYGLEELYEINEDTIWIDIDEENRNITPFVPYADYKNLANMQEEMDIVADKEESVSVNTEGKYPPTQEVRRGVEIQDVIKVFNEKIEDEKGQEKIIYNFGGGNYGFIPSSSLVQGRVLSSNIKRSGSNSLRLEYNILALEDENRAYIDLSSNNITLKMPPRSLGLWVYSYGYSPGTLGIKLKNKVGEDIDINIIEGITWTGWHYIETNKLKDIKSYPLTIDKLFYEIPYESEDVGVLLLDKLEVSYLKNVDNPIGQYQFYVVKEDDDIEGISNKIYGTPTYKNEILNLNGIKDGDILTVGMVLVLKSP